MPPKPVLGLMGSSPSGGAAALSTTAQLTALLQLAAKHNILDLDTARAYSNENGSAEALLGSVDKSLTSKFRIDTKAPAFMPGSLTKEKIQENYKLSLEALKEEKVNLYYLHGPDNKTPIEEQAGTIASLPQPWGVSNISPTILREMVDFVDRHGLPRPTTYQGIYNPIHRTGESDLLPLLKELNMNFYAYSPLAGGIFAKPLEKILAPEKGDRYDAMKFFGGMYLSNPTMVAAIRDLAKTCQTHSLSLLEATIRWFRWHSALGEGDGVIFGCSRFEQFEEAAKFFESEKLSGEMVEAFEQLWRSIPEEARSPSYFDAGAAKKATEKYGKP